MATTMSFTALDGLMMGTRCGSIDPGVLLYLIDQHGMDARALQRAPLRAVRPARRLRDLQRHARAAGQHRRAPPPRRWTCSSTASAASSARSRPRSAGSTPWSSPAASARTPHRSARASVATRAGSDWSSTSRRMRAAVPHQPADSRVSAWVIPTDEESMIALHTRRVLESAGASVRPELQR